MPDNTIPLTPEQKKQIGAKIKKVRVEKSYSLRRLAEKLHMSMEELERMEDGDFELYDDTVSDFIH